jgi:hypothetical protein
MIGDHHGWSAGRANLLVREVDTILATYRCRQDSPEVLGDL